MRALILMLLFSSWVQAQDTAGYYGFRYFKINFQQTPVDILVWSEKNNADTKKPIFFFCQGSLPQPLIKEADQGIYGVFPFNPEILSKKYHVVIVGKPGVPVKQPVQKLNPQLCYTDVNGDFPALYRKHNLLSYYVPRNKAVIDFLLKQSWTAKTSLVVAGHSEGSTIAAHMAANDARIQSLIYAGGTPHGRILAMIAQARTRETDTVSFATKEFDYWANIHANQFEMPVSKGDSYQNIKEFSVSVVPLLLKMKKPVLIVYGGKDWGAPYNDLLRAMAIQEKNPWLSFKDYPGTEHNFFPISKEGKIDYGQYNWDKVAMDWLNWLNLKR
jgi:dienelactone hydrolase